MEYQGNEIYWRNGTCWAVPINADGTFDVVATCEATDTPDVIRELARYEEHLRDGWPVYVLTEGERGAFVLSLNEHDSELPLAEGQGATILAAADELLSEALRLLEPLAP